jgi:predicted  nucleic acid-binding Zn-ribbon protein
MEVKEKMKILIGLYEKDKEIDKIKNLEIEVPKKIAKLDEELENLSKEFNEAKETSDKIDVKRRELERRVEEQRLNLDNFRKRKREAHSNKEFQALKREIEDTEKKIIQLEDELIEVYIEKEDQEKITNKTRIIFEEKEKKVREKEELLNRELNKSKENLILKADERTRIAARLQDERLLKSYNRLKNSRGSGVSIIENEICTECHSTIPLQLFVEVKKGNKIYTCQSCGRILIYKWIE